MELQKLIDNFKTVSRHNPIFPSVVSEMQSVVQQSETASAEVITIKELLESYREPETLSVPSLFLTEESVRYFTPQAAISLVRERQKLNYVYKSINLSCEPTSELLKNLIAKGLSDSEFIWDAAYLVLDAIVYCNSDVYACLEDEVCKLLQLYDERLKESITSLDSMAFFSPVKFEENANLLKILSFLDKCEGTSRAKEIYLNNLKGTEESFILQASTCIQNLVFSNKFQKQLGITEAFRKLQELECSNLQDYVWVYKQSLVDTKDWILEYYDCISDETMLSEVTSSLAVFALNKKSASESYDAVSDVQLVKTTLDSYGVNTIGYKKAFDAICEKCRR